MARDGRALEFVRARFWEPWVVVEAAASDDGRRLALLLRAIEADDAALRPAPRAASTAPARQRRSDALDAGRLPRGSPVRVVSSAGQRRRSAFRVERVSRRRDVRAPSSPQMTWPERLQAHPAVALEAFKVSGSFAFVARALLRDRLFMLRAAAHRKRAPAPRLRLHARGGGGREAAGGGGG